MSIASIVSVLAALLILGIFLILAFNIKHITNEMENQLELKVFLVKDVNQEQKESLENTFKDDSQIESFKYQSKEDALLIMSNRLDQYDNILKGLEEDNPLPEAYIIKAKDASSIRTLNETITKLDGVDYINYGEGYVDTLIKFNHFTNVLTMGVLVILTGISLFIIYNTIKITVFAKRKEIGIMKLAGATNWYIRVPFIIEGSILGVLGSILAVLVIRNGYYYLLGLIQGQSVLMMGVTFAPAGAIMPQITQYFLLYGLVVGSVGSLFAIRKFLDV